MGGLVGAGRKQVNCFVFWEDEKQRKRIEERNEEEQGGTNFLAFDFAPRLHSWSSTAAFFAFSTAALALAASAFCRDRQNSKMYGSTDAFALRCVALRWRGFQEDIHTLALPAAFLVFSPP